VGDTPLDLNREVLTERRVPRSPQRRRRLSTRTKVLLGVGAFILAVILVFVIEAGINYNKIHSGISVAGVELGGLSEEEATAALAKYAREAQADPIKLTAGGKTWSVKPTEIGATVDVAGAVTAAMDVTRDGNIFTNMGRRWKLYFSAVDLPLQSGVDRSLLDPFIAEIAEELKVEPVDAGLAVAGGDIQITGGLNGQTVDTDALRTELSALLVSMKSGEVPIPLIVTKPNVVPEDNQAALDQAKTMIGAPVTLKRGDKSWTLRTADIIKSLQFSSEMKAGALTLIPVLSASELEGFLAEIAPAVVKEPVDATFDSDGKKAWVVPAQPGEELDHEGTLKAIELAALKPSGRTAEVAVKEAEADFTTEEAEAWGIEDLLASYTTEPYAGSSNRQVNVRITTKYASDKFLAPGEEYDFDKVIGPRTSARGYKPAPGIVGGGELEDVLGGGICQVSTTLFNAVFEAGIQVTERHNHSLYISHYPDGRDATVAGGGGKNFRFKNDTGHHIWIRGVSDGITTTFNIYGTDDGREVKWSFSGFSYGATRTEVTVLNNSLSPGSSRVKISGQSGRSCSVKRTITYADGTKKTETFNSYYPMIPKTIEVGPTPATTTTVKKPPSATTTTTEFGLPPDITAPQTEF